MKSETVNHEQRYLSAIFSELIRLGSWHKANPLANVRQIKTDQVAQPLEECRASTNNHTLQRIRGHPSITMTMRHANRSPEHLESAMRLSPIAQLDKLDSWAREWGAGLEAVFTRALLLLAESTSRRVIKSLFKSVFKGANLGARL